jgi:LysR family nitrogen assimilation transcriptional regulator
MDMRQINYFLLVAEAGSFSAAAASARIAQPALSRKVRQLEEALSVTLFVRHRRGVSLTEEGTLFRDRLAAVIRQLEQLRDDTAGRAAEPSGRVVMGMPPSMRTMLTSEVVHRFSIAFPGVQLRITEGLSVSLREMVAKGLADLVVITSLDPVRELDRVPLCDERLYLVGPYGLGLRPSRAVKLTRLAGKNLIMTTFPNGLRVLIEAALSKARLSTTIRHEANSVPLIVDLVRRGHGYAVLPYSAVHKHIDDREVSAAPIVGLSVTWVIASSTERPLSSSGRRLFEMIMQTVDHLIREGRWPGATVHR